MSFGMSGTLEGDIAADHVDALPSYVVGDDAAQAEALQAVKDGIKLVLSRTFKTGSVSVSVSGHANTDGTGYVSISLNASQPKVAVLEAATPPAAVVVDAAPVSGDWPAAEIAQFESERSAFEAAA